MAYTAIDDPEAYFQVQLYTGDGNDNRALTLDGDTDMQPALLWIKGRSAGEDHMIFDAVRGVTKHLNSNVTDVDNTDTSFVKSFDSDGFYALCTKNLAEYG